VIKIRSVADLTTLLHGHDLHSTFPNVSIALRMLVSVLCLMVSNCSGEHSFSKMALIENKLQSTMTDRRLSALELLSVEIDVLDRVSFVDIIEKFVTGDAENGCSCSFVGHTVLCNVSVELNC